MCGLGFQGRIRAFPFQAFKARSFSGLVLHESNEDTRATVTSLRNLAVLEP